MTYDFVGELRIIALSFSEDDNGRRLVSRFVEEFIMGNPSYRMGVDSIIEELMRICQEAGIDEMDPIVSFLDVALTHPNGVCGPHLIKLSPEEEKRISEKAWERFLKNLQ